MRHISLTALMLAASCAATTGTPDRVVEPPYVPKRSRVGTHCCQCGAPVLARYCVCGHRTIPPKGKRSCCREQNAPPAHNNESTL